MIGITHLPHAYYELLMERMKQYGGDATLAGQIMVQKWIKSFQTDSLICNFGMRRVRLA
jgi:hypothetical protein